MAKKINSFDYLKTLPYYNWVRYFFRFYIGSDQGPKHLIDKWLPFEVTDIILDYIDHYYKEKHKLNFKPTEAILRAIPENIPGYKIASPLRVPILNVLMGGGDAVRLPTFVRKELDEILENIKSGKFPGISNYIHSYQKDDGGIIQLAPRSKTPIYYIKRVLLGGYATNTEEKKSEIVIHFRRHCRLSVRVMPYDEINTTGYFNTDFNVKDCSIS